MKKRLHDKKAGIAIIISLLIISLAEIIFRATVMEFEAILTTANLGEQLAVVVLAATILILTAKGKDRACYICYGAWIAYFALDQLFELPGAITGLVAATNQTGVYTLVIVAVALRIISMICIVAIGGVLVEYMTDGTINNRIFNILSVATILMLAAYVIIAIIGLVSEGITDYVLAIFNTLYQIIMVFLFTFFAYDSAKAQLKKTNLSK